MIKSICTFILRNSFSYRFIHKSTTQFQSKPLISEKLSNRHLIQVSGAESSTFLQGLLTADLNLLENEQTDKYLYSMMLNIQGRILYDVFVYKIEKVYKEDSSLLLECEESLVHEIVKFLKIYKIRKKLKFAILDDLSVWVVMKDPKESFNNNLNPFISIKNEVLFLKPDPRLPFLAHRMLLPSSIEASEVLHDTTQVSGEYTKLRYIHGVPEGPSDLPPTNSLPLEANLQFLNGVSFSKGCYIGQELTARTHHTGVIRKRIMPLFSKENLDLDLVRDDLRVVSTSTGKEVGRVRAWQGKQGLGLLRLQETLLDTSPLVIKKASGLKKGKDAGDEEESAEVFGEVTTAIPEWWPLEEDEIIKKTVAKIKST